MQNRSALELKKMKFTRSTHLLYSTNLPGLLYRFFFVISGFFWGRKVQCGQGQSYTIYNLKRFVFLFAVWSLIYLTPYNFTQLIEHGILGPIKCTYWYLLDLSSRPMTFLFQGTKVHLWFFMGMICSLLISYLFVVKEYKKTIMLVSFILYFIGLLGKAYADTPFGFYTDFNTRNGPFFGTVFFVTGYFLSAYKPDTSWFLLGLFMFSAGILIHFSELYILWINFQVLPIHDFLFGTYFIGVGFSLIALSDHKIMRNKQLSMLGKYTLGIYLVHYIFVDLLKPLNNYMDIILCDTLILIAVFSLSLAVVKYMHTSKYLSKIIN